MRLSQPIWAALPATRDGARLGDPRADRPTPARSRHLGLARRNCSISWSSSSDLSTGENLLLSAAGGYVAVAFCGEAEFRLGRKDPGEVILDEFVAMPLCFLGFPRLELGSPRAWMTAALLGGGFALFRLFDIAKPLGIRRLQDLPGGWGVVLDDTAAALASCAVLHGAAALWLWRS